jgi:hypothetical protein
MIFFGKKKYSDDAEKFENFFRDVRKKMFEIKLKMRDEEGKTISTTDCEVIKFSSLNDAIYEAFRLFNEEQQILHQRSGGLNMVQ